MPASALPSSVVRCASAVGVDRDDARLRLALGDRDGRLGRPGELDPLGLGLGLGDRVPPFSPSARRICAAASASAGRTMLVEQLLLLARRLELGQLGLLAGDLLGRLGLGQRAGLGGARLGGGGLRLGLGAAQRDVPRGVDLDLLGLGLADGGLLVGGGLGHAGVALAAGGLLLADQLHVAGLVADRLDRERVDLQARRREVALAASWTACWNFCRSRFSSSTVSVPTIERSEPSRTFLTIESTSSSLRLEEALGGVADGLVVGPDLERRDALDRDLDALAGDGVGECDVDLAGGQLELADLVEERQDDDAAAAHDLEVPACRPGPCRAGR